MGNSAGVAKLCFRKIEVADNVVPEDGSYRECKAVSATIQSQQTPYSTCDSPRNCAFTSCTVLSGTTPRSARHCTPATMESRLKGEYGTNAKLARDHIGMPATGTGIILGHLNGMDLIKNPRFHKGLGFTLEERQHWGIHGLLAPCVKTQEEQVEHCLMEFHRYKSNMERYIYLIGLLDRNEKLFYRVVCENIVECLPIVYTPTVGEACLKYGLIYYRPHGLFISRYDIGHVYEVLCNWTEQEVRAIVVTDGERVLGLGDLGVSGMGISVGKLTLYTALGGFKPQHCLPICIDVGTDNKTQIEDPTYLGIRKPRLRGQEYDDLIDEFMEAVVRRFGQNTLIQFEDFGNRNAFRFLNKYRSQYCTFNDDIQGTASVAVAGLISAMKVTGNKLSDNILLFQGAGEAATGIANLVIMAMMAEGTSEEEAIKKIFMMDSKGLLSTSRPEGPHEEHKKKFMKDMPPSADLMALVKSIKPTVLIGAAALPGSFTPVVLQEMAKINKRPVIFALSNPTSKAECTAQEAYDNTDGRCVYVSGSPFPLTTYKGKTYQTGQGNNAYIFPGVALGVVCSGAKIIPDDVFLTAAEVLAGLITQEDLDKGCLFRPLTEIRECSVAIAVAIACKAYEDGNATIWPQPDDMESFIRAQMYNYHYESILHPMYKLGSN